MKCVANTGSLTHEKVESLLAANNFNYEENTTGIWFKGKKYFSIKFKYYTLKLEVTPDSLRFSFEEPRWLIGILIIVYTLFSQYSKDRLWLLACLLLYIILILLIRPNMEKAIIPITDVLLTQHRSNP